MENKFMKVLLASRRAKQLINGDKMRLDIKAENPLTIAMEEINQGKVDYNYIVHMPLMIEEPKPEEPPKEGVDAIASLLAGKIVEPVEDDEDQTPDEEEIEEDEDLEETDDEIEDEESEDIDEEEEVKEEED